MSEENATSHYVGEAGRKYHEGKRGIPTTAIPWVAALRAEKLAHCVKATDTVLEYGVGAGWNLAHLVCAKRMGFDVSKFLEPEVHKLGIDFVASTQGILASSIDVVICHHTLEHVPNPAEVLQEIKRVLQKNGTLLLFVPFEKERRYRHYNPAEPNHHLYSWNVQTLGNLVADKGFQIAEAHVAPFGYDRFAAKWATRFCLGEKGFRLLRSALHLIKPASEVRLVARKVD